MCVMAEGFAGPWPQKPPQSAGSGAFAKPQDTNPASGSAFSSVIGSRGDRGLRKSFGNDVAVVFYFAFAFVE